MDIPLAPIHCFYHLLQQNRSNLSIVGLQNFLDLFYCVLCIEQICINVQQPNYVQVENFNFFRSFSIRSLRSCLLCRLKFIYRCHRIMLRRNSCKIFSNVPKFTPLKSFQFQRSFIIKPHKKSIIL